MRLRERSWRKYADRVGAFGAQYRKRIGDGVTATVRRWRARVGGPLAENAWLAFALKLFDTGVRQGATRNNSARRRRVDSEFARFLDLIDVDVALAWNRTLVDR